MRRTKRRKSRLNALSRKRRRPRPRHHPQPRIYFGGALSIPSTEPQENVFIKMYPLKIMLVNNEKEPTPFTLSMLQNEYNNINTGKLTETYPLFTNKVKYPPELYNISYNKIVKFFFNKTIFKNTLEEYAKSNPTSSNYVYIKKDSEIDNTTVEKHNNKIEIENEKHNIQLMLTTLLQILPATYINTKSSFDNFILRKPSFVINNYSTKDIVLSFAQNDDRYITDMIWLNDIYNHPIYNKFIETYNETHEKKIALKPVQQETRKKIIVGFIGTLEKLNKLTSKYGGGETMAKVLFNSFDTLNKNARDTITLNISEWGLNILKEMKYNDKKQEINIKEYINQKSLEVIDDNNLGFFINMIGQYVVNILRELTEVNKYKNRIIFEQRVMSTLNEIYNAYILVEASVQIKDFIEGKIKQLDLKKKYDDGTNKLKYDIDIINAIETRFNSFVILNNEIKNSIQSVYIPNRDTTNEELKKELKLVKEPYFTKEEHNVSKDFFDNIYKYYFLQRRDSGEFNKDKMYTGINIIGAKTDNEKNEYTPENAEIYVAVKTIGTKEYYENPQCLINDNHLAQKIIYNLRDNPYSVKSYNE